MKALTLKQPWAWAVAHAGKDVENRTWKPPASVIGHRIAIHAGRTSIEANDGEGVDAYEDIVLAFHVACEDDPYDYPKTIIKRGRIQLGGIIAVATIEGWVTERDSYKTRSFAGNYLDAAPLAVKHARQSKWFTGPYGWLLTDVIALPEPIPCKGSQGLWTVPVEVEAEINRQVKFA